MNCAASVTSIDEEAKMDRTQYELATARRDDLLREAANHRLARQASISEAVARSGAPTPKRRAGRRTQRLRVAPRG
jgi:hypothetical protein